MRSHASALAVLSTLCLLTVPCLAQDRPRVDESAAQIQLRTSATTAASAGQHLQAAELLEGYLQLGPNDLGYLELAAARIAAGQCESASAALAAAAAAPRASVITTEQAADRTRRVQGELALGCEGAVDPEVLYELGVEYFADRKWTKAARAFELAFGDDPNTVLAYNAGRSFEYAGDLERAVVYYEKALELDPDPELRDRLERTLERLGNLRARTEQGEEVGLVDVSSRPKGAIVRINGVVVGQTPYQAAHPVGEYEITVEAEGFGDYERDVVLESGKEVVVDVALNPASRYWTWVSLAGTLATAAGGVGLGLLADSALTEARDPETRRDPAAFSDATDRGRALAGSSIALYAAASVGAILTVWLYVVETPEAADNAALSVLIGPQWVGLQFDW
jgi:tetratricopeptide (TPR) repeat protein